MKKYLREIEMAGVILASTGIVNSLIWGSIYGGWICGIGIELTNMAVLTEEVGELARVMARKYGDQSFKEGEKDNIGEEMADVLWVLLCLANQTGVDLTEELKKSMEKKTQRDALRHIHNKKLMA